MKRLTLCIDVEDSQMAALRQWIEGPAHAIVTKAAGRPANWDYCVDEVEDDNAGQPDPNASEKEGQHSDPNGAFEVFWPNGMSALPEPGWYWWSCSPGCLPDGEAQGPYATSTEAWQAATDLDFSINHGDFLNKDWAK